jgi:hypothetical protein
MSFERGANKYEREEMKFLEVLERLLKIAVLSVTFLKMIGWL